MDDSTSDLNRTTLTVPEDSDPTMTVRPTVSAEGPLAGQPQASLQSLLPLRIEVGGKSDQVDIQVLDLIGAGGMGVVHKAVQTSLQRDIAIKRLKAGQPEELGQAMLLREALLLGRLEHPAVPPVHLLGHDQDGNPVIAMRKIGGQPWSQQIGEIERDEDGYIADRGELSRHLHIFVTVANATAFAHSRGIIHRDIKPANVMVDDYGEVYLIDWGLALELQDACTLTCFAGTPAYAAPEMVTPGAPLSAQTDIYLLGATLHELLTGKARHQGSGVHEVIEQASISETYSYSRGIPRMLAMACNRATAADPADRFPDSVSLIDEVEQFVQHVEAINIADDAQGILDQLRVLTADPSADAGVVEELGIRCRYALSRAVAAWPDNLQSRSNYLDCLVLLADHALSRHNIAATRVLLEELEQNPELEENASGIRDQLRSLIQQYDTRPDEISTQIQYTLMEKLAEVRGKQDPRKGEN